MYFIIFHLLDRIIISKDSLKKLCNKRFPASFKSISDINYKELNSISIRLIGCYGNHTLIAKLLLDKKIIDQQMYVIYSLSGKKIISMVVRFLILFSYIYLGMTCSLLRNLLRTNLLYVLVYTCWN